MPNDDIGHQHGRVPNWVSIAVTVFVFLVVQVGTAGAIYGRLSERLDTVDKSVSDARGEISGARREINEAAVAAARSVGQTSVNTQNISDHEQRLRLLEVGAALSRREDQRH